MTYMSLGVFISVKPTNIAKMSDGLLFVIVILTAIYAFYKWATANDKYFEQRNVKFVKPTFLIGNTGDLFFNRCSAAEYSKNIYNQFTDET